MTVFHNRLRQVILKLHYNTYYTGALIVKSTREYKKQSKLNSGMNFQSSLYHEYNINPLNTELNPICQ